MNSTMKCVALALLMLSVLAFADVQPALAASNLKDCLTQARDKDVPESEFKPFMQGCLKQDAPNALTAEKKEAIKTRISSCLARANKQNLQGKMRHVFLRTCLGS